MFCTPAVQHFQCRIGGNVAHAVFSEMTCCFACAGESEEHHSCATCCCAQTFNGYLEGKGAVATRTRTGMWLLGMISE